jgi:hypothetical protein
MAWMGSMSLLMMRQRVGHGLLSCWHQVIIEGQRPNFVACACVVPVLYPCAGVIDEYITFGRRPGRGVMSA